ncbi:hypothetical protein Golomagni_00251 [Golovinomyces magnicellulatus]|nr:hypothetical protein Golomagni_00251 [Golovinomyces magnicellulatus]
MLTYIPIYLTQGIATRSTIKAIPRPPARSQTVCSSAANSKAKKAFRLRKVKSEFLDIHRISCIRISRAASKAIDLRSSSEHNASKKTSTPLDTEKRTDLKRNKFLTPQHQVGRDDSTSSQSGFSDVTISTIHENLEEYKNQNSSTGFWSPVRSDTSRNFAESRPQYSENTKFSSLAEASRSQEAIFYRRVFEAERYMIKPRDQTWEDLVNKISATLAAMFPSYAIELSSMRKALFYEFIGTTDIRELKMEGVDRKNDSFNAKRQTINFKNQTELHESLSHFTETTAKNTRETVFFEEIIELYKERTKQLRAEIEEWIDETLVERQEESIRSEIATRKQKSLTDKIHKLERMLDEAQIIRRKEERNENRFQNRTICIQPSFQLHDGRSSQTSLLIFTDKNENSER